MATLFKEVSYNLATIIQQIEMGNIILSSSPDRQKFEELQKKRSNSQKMVEIEMEALRIKANTASWWAHADLVQAIVSRKFPDSSRYDYVQYSQWS